MKDFKYQQADEARVSLTEHDVDWLQDGGFQVLSTLTGNPAMTKQIAMRLGLSRARVQFIIDRLYQRGLVTVYKEVHEADRVEIYYTASTKDLSLQVGKQASLEAQLAGAQIILSTLQEYIRRSIANVSNNSLTTLKLVQSRMDRARATEFLVRLEQLAKEFDSTEEESAVEEFAMSLSLCTVLERPGHME